MGNTDAERTQLTKTRYIGQSSKGVEVWDACIQITGENIGLTQNVQVFWRKQHLGQMAYREHPERKITEIIPIEEL